MLKSRQVSLLLPLLLTLVAAADAPGAARYAADGSLLIPADNREWVYLSSGLDMSYSEAAAMMDHSMFDNVFVDAASWAAFKRSGHWPEHSVFALEIRGAESKGSINKRGQFQTGEVMGLEFHVHDSARFKGGWAFFAANGPRSASLLPASAACYACHQAHGAVDTTFTQFYPVAKAIAKEAGSYREQPP
jgi:hypothetical protein